MNTARVAREACEALLSHAAAANTLRARVLRSLLVVTASVSASVALAQQPIVAAPENLAGRTVYENTCAVCHAQPEATKAPPVETLRRMGPRAVSHALTNGKMRVQAANLSAKDLDAVVSYLAGTAEIDNSWIAPLTCSASRRKVSTGKATIGQWGFDSHNHRRLTAAQSGLATRDIAKLELAWTMAFPQTANMRAQPAIVGDTMHLSIVDSGQLFALDIGGDEPCVEWVYQHDVPLRTALGYAEYRGRHVLLFADAAAHVLMVDAVTAKVIWTATVKVTSVSNVTAMPVLYEDRVFVPISSGELNMGAAHDYECCTSHGAVVALDARDGQQLWVYHTMEDAKPTAISRVGTQQWGPSGAPIWTAAALDEKRRLLYVGTGENTSHPATASSDAVLAIRIDDGTLAWSFQATPQDIYLTGCAAEPDGPNCPPDYSIKKDWDFGAGLMLVQKRNGDDLVVAGQKNGVLWALNPNDGTRVWDTKIGPGGALGGIHWGMAYDGRRVYVPNNQSSGPTADGSEPGLHAVDVDTGRVVWSYRPEPDCSGDRRAQLPSCASNWGLSAAALLIDGAVVTGSNDGFVRANDAATGKLLFACDTARPFTTVNGIEGKGGAIDNAAIVAANRTLFVQSGYGLMGVPGNLLLAFKPSAKATRRR